MTTRRQFLRGAGAGAVAAAGAALLPGLAASASAGEPTGLSAAATTAQPGGQSPIDIRLRDVVPDLRAEPLVFDYPTSVSLELNYISKDTTTGDPDLDPGCLSRDPFETVEGGEFSSPARVRRFGQDYELAQFHFHTRSEHSVAGVHTAIEQHFVHRRVSDGALLVVGLFLRLGGRGTVQDQVLGALPEECEEPVHVGRVNLRRLLPNDLSSWNYSGSLTTPPYTEGVTWHVLRETKAIQANTIHRFQELFPNGNARPTQPVNGRVVRAVRGALA